METKTQKAIELYLAGNFKKSLAIFKTFKLNITKNDRDILITTYEWISGHDKFYANMGYNLKDLKNQSKDIIEKNFIK